MAVIDVAGFVADLKDHAVDHGFHVHDERHFVETYSMRQAWEVDLHPETACGGPLDLHLALEVDPRVLFAFEDEVLALPDEDAEPADNFRLPLIFTWTLPPLVHGPDLLVLATELAGVGGPELPLEVSAVDSFGSVTDPSQRSLTVVARVEVSLAKIYLGQIHLQQRRYPEALRLFQEALTAEPYNVTAAYNAGDRPLIDLLDAQRNYRETYRLYISARAGFWRAFYRYNAAIGQQVLTHDPGQDPAGPGG